jgi:hypothetical protein
MNTTFEVQETDQTEKKLESTDISLSKEDRDYLLTLKAKKMDRSKLSVAKNYK